MEFSNFSNRFSQESGMLQLMEDLSHAANGASNIIMLGGGNPATIDTMEQVFRSKMEDIMANSRDFENMVGFYDSPQGSDEFIQGLCELFQKEYGWPVTPKNIAITNGSQAGFGVLFNLLSGQFADGSFKKILLPMIPEYIGYEDVGLADEPIFLSKKPLIEKQGNFSFKYHVDFDNLEIDDNVGAICISRPCNPTGNVVDDNELAQLRSLAIKHDIPLIIDGAYGLPFPSIIFTDATPIWDTNIVVCLSLSKLGMPGARSGIIVADESFISMMTRSNAVFTLAPGRFGPTLASRLVQSGELLKLSETVIKPYYQKRSNDAIKLARASMHDIPARVHLSEGSIFIWLWFENLPITSQTLYERLKVRDVYILSGHHFFPGFDENWKHQHECIRVSYAASEQDVKKGLEIIADEVRKAYNDAA